MVDSGTCSWPIQLQDCIRAFMISRMFCLFMIPSRDYLWWITGLQDDTCQVPTFHKKIELFVLRNYYFSFGHLYQDPCYMEFAMLPVEIRYCQ